MYSVNRIIFLNGMNANYFFVAYDRRVNRTRSQHGKPSQHICQLLCTEFDRTINVNRMRHYQSVKLAYEGRLNRPKKKSFDGFDDGRYTKCGRKGGNHTV